MESMSCVVKTGYASKHANEKVQVDAKYRVDTDICEDAFEDVKTC